MIRRKKEKLKSSQLWLIIIPCRISFHHISNVVYLAEEDSLATRV